MKRVAYRLTVTTEDDVDEEVLGEAIFDLIAADMTLGIDTAESWQPAGSEPST